MKNFKSKNELDRMHGLNWHDHGVRMSDPAIGRWHVVDPLAEKYPEMSPYALCGNDPVNFVDKDGREPGDFFKTIRAAAKDFGYFYNDNSIGNGCEYASVAFTVTNDKGEIGYSYSVANIGDNKSSIPSAVYGNTQEVALFHTHGEYNPKFGKGNNLFSGVYKDGKLVKDKRNQLNLNTDIGQANKRNLLIYVATPNGSLQEYSPKTGKIEIISNDMPSDPNDPTRLNLNHYDEKQNVSLRKNIEMQEKINRGIQNNNTR